LRKKYFLLQYVVQFGSDTDQKPKRLAADHAELLDNKSVNFLDAGQGVRGYSLIGKTAILHIVILGSSPNISI